jgi:hypothetical protein
MGQLRHVKSIFSHVPAQSANLGAQVLYVGIQLTRLPVQLTRAQALCIFFYAGITARAKMTSIISKILPAVFSHMALVKYICANETRFSFHAVLACLDLSATIGSNNDARCSCHWNESTDVPLLQQRARHALAARTSPPSHRKYLPSGRAA